jgi:hypothetical protein
LAASHEKEAQIFANFAEFVEEVEVENQFLILASARR